MEVGGAGAPPGVGLLPRPWALAPAPWHGALGAAHARLLPPSLQPSTPGLGTSALLPARLTATTQCPPRWHHLPPSST